jgi:hypothetical protein
MRRGKRDSAVLSALTNRTPRRLIINCGHVAIKVKRLPQIKLAYLGGFTKDAKGQRS